MSAPDSEERPALKAYRAGTDAAGQRLDQWLAAAIGPDMSRSRIQGLIKGGAVTIGGKPVIETKHKLHGGEEIVLDVPAATPAEPEGEDIALSVIYEDEHLIVIDKPAGLSVHPGAGHASGTLVNALIAHCGDSLSGIGGVLRPGIVHRLDKDTTGLLVVAKSDAAHAGLAEQFATHGNDGRLVRRYQAIAWGAPPRARGTIDAPLARSTANRTRIAVTAAGSGRRAVTHYRVLERYAGDGRSEPVASRLELILETGRTHQIRVHLAHLGHPLLGDRVYGSGFQASARTLGEEARVALEALGRQALHAAELGFVHPRTGKRLLFESALPADMARLAAALAVAKA
jgi:23S rRNA pseudouridine1911/1915/1917 synthase